MGNQSSKLRRLDSTKLCPTDRVFTQQTQA